MLSVDKRNLFFQTFLDYYRTNDWEAAYRPAGTYCNTVVVSTLRKATCNLTVVFRIRVGESPLHLSGLPNLQPFVQSWLQGCDNVEPPKLKQWEVTPQLLQAMFKQARRGTEPSGDSRDAVISEIEVAAYFYAMRFCEITATAAPGCTKIIRLRGLVFRDSSHREIPDSSPQLGEAHRITVTFENQKQMANRLIRGHRRGLETPWRAQLSVSPHSCNGC
jgi:hypothetical protein